MKKEQLIEIIQKLVRQEVKNCLPQLIAEMALSVQNGSKQSLRETPQVSQTHIQVRKSAPVEKKRYTDNAVLNDILNETTALAPDMEGLSLHSMMTEGSVGSIDDVPLDQIPGFNPKPHYSQPVAPVSNGQKPAIKDYAAFLKKMDAAAARRRPV